MGFFNGKIKVFGFDTETDNNGIDEAWIVQWAISDGKDEITGYNCQTFKETLHRISTYKGRTTYLYAHNLKYDWSFVRYAVDEFLHEQNGRWEPKYVMRKGQVISITLSDKVRKSKIIFRDSLKKMKGTLAEIAQLFGMQKLDPVGEDFSPGWSKKVDFSDQKQWDYVRMDARIVAVAMQYLHSEGYDKATSSGDCWKTAKKFVNKDYSGEGNRWETLFPELSYRMDSFHRCGYAGGINISQGIGCHKGPITHVDYTSMYPSCLYFDEFPFDIPSDNGNEWPGLISLWVGRMTLKLKLKEGHVPWFMFRSGYDYIIEQLEFGTIIEQTYEWHELTLTSIDFMNLANDYDIEEDPESLDSRQFYIYKKTEGFLNEFIDFFIKQKQEAEKGSATRAQAKTMLNACYGRFALAKDQEQTEMVWSEEEQDLVYKSSIVQQEENDSYLPVAMFCTSYARGRLLDMVRRVSELYGPQAIIHCDTDSVIYEGEPVPDDEYGGGLGCWAFESHPVKIYEGGFKRYIEVLHEPVRGLKDLAVACAGVPQKKTDEGVPVGMWVELLDDPEIICRSAVLGHKEYRIKSQWLRELYTEHGMDPDKVNTMKLLPKQVHGGTILTEHTHELSDNMQVRFNRGY